MIDHTVKEGMDVRVRVNGKWASGKVDEIYDRDGVQCASVAWYDIGCMTDDIPLSEIYPEQSLSPEELSLAEAIGLGIGGRGVAEH